MNFTIVGYFGYNLSSHERFKLIKESGFNGVSGLLWQNDFDSDYQLFPNMQMTTIYLSKRCTRHIAGLMMHGLIMKVDVIFSDIQSKRLGFCFDSGHWNIFMQNTDLLTLYGDRFMALHLHDNDGCEDWHALPLSGNINWNDITDKLKALHYNGAISLEVGNRGFDEIKEPSEFLQIALERAKKIFC